MRLLGRILGWGLLALSGVAVLALIVGYLRSDNDCAQLRAAGAPRNPMRAVVYCEYGTAEVLELREIEKPVPSGSELLVRVHAAAVNPLDWHYIRGTPYVMRLDSGLRVPKRTRLGVDFAGTVEAVGSGVGNFKPGDAVFGGQTGAFAEYLVVRADRSVVAKPEELSFEQAAAVPIAAITALQGLRDTGRVGPGQRVLINGASGGVGTFAVQIAKAMGAHVTGVCSTRNVELVRALGADEVIDYTTSDYAAGEPGRYDVILDNVGNRSLGDNRRVLNAGGRYVLIGGGGPDDGRWIGAIAKPLKALIVSPFVPQRLSPMVASLNPQDLEELSRLMREGKVTPVIDRRYPLAEAREAIDYLEQGRARGKVILLVD